MMTDADRLAFIGLVSLTCGLLFVWPPLALIVDGVLLLGAGVAIARRNRTQPEAAE